MPTRRINLPAGQPVNLNTAANLVNGTRYTGQHRGTDGPVYVAELAAADPTANDVASAGYVFGTGATFTLQPVAGQTIYAMAPNGGRITIGELP